MLHSPLVEFFGRMLIQFGIESTPNVTLKFLQLFLSQLFPLPPPHTPHRLRQLLQLDNRLFFSPIQQSVTRYWHFRLVPHILYILFSKFWPLCKPAWPFQAHLQPIWVELFYLKFIAKSRLVCMFSLPSASQMHLLYVSIGVSASVTKIFQKLLHYARHLPAKWI